MSAPDVVLAFLPLSSSRWPHTAIRLTHTDITRLTDAVLKIPLYTLLLNTLYYTICCQEPCPYLGLRAKQCYNTTLASAIIYWLETVIQMQQWHKIYVSNCYEWEVRKYILACDICNELLLFNRGHLNLTDPYWVAHILLSLVNSLCCSCCQWLKLRIICNVLPWLIGARKWKVKTNIIF